jgi:hypothetical protein
MEEDSQVLLLSLGAQKSGTSWLSRYLREHPQCHVTPVKELHYFDQRNTVRTEDAELKVARMKRNAKLLKHAKRMERRARKSGPEACGGRDEAYFQGMQRFISHMMEGDEVSGPTPKGFWDVVSFEADPSAKAIVEFTPANGLLPNEVLSGFQDLPVKTKYVFLMRDPVARAWSQVRMLAKGRANDADDLEEVTKLTGALVEKFLEGKQRAVEMRSDYASMLKRFSEVIPAEDLFIEFYEDLMSQETIDRFCDFAGLERHAADFDTVHHEGVKVALTDDVRMRLRDYLKPQYDAVKSHVGRIPAKWQATLEATK